MRCLFVSFVTLTLGCATDAADPIPPTQEPPVPLPNDPLRGLPQGQAQWELLCARGHGDMISRAFCEGTAPPAISSLADLRDVLGLSIDPRGANRVTMLAHSTAIGGRFVTELNPRVFVMTAPLPERQPNPEYQVLAFTRGEPFVELVANDPTTGSLRFFLVRFHPTCESAPGGCNFADLLTPSIESNWDAYSLYDDDDIKNTTLDCLQCHQPDVGGRKILRMQELTRPWTHWFYDDDGGTNEGHMLAFRQAHGEAPYGGVSLAAMEQPTPPPQELQTLLENNGFAIQPNEFKSQTIRLELLASQGTSPTWDAIYERAVSGDEIAVPYLDAPHTDPAKRASAIAAYRNTMTGAMAREAMPDIRDIILDSAEADLSYRPKAGLDGKAIIAHMCQHCHNSRLDQTLSRASFNVQTLTTLPRAEKDEAIRRLQLPDTDIQKMPPPRYHSLSDAERDLVIGELQK